jgi:hypothetical protein
MNRGGGPMPGFAPDAGEMRFVYGAPFAASAPQVGPLQDWGPPEPVYMPILSPLRGHPYVWCRSLPGPELGWPPRPSWSIDCQCKACGGTYHRDCEFPPKSGHWIADFAAKHAHGDLVLQDAWTEEVHRGLYRLRQAYPSEG